MKTLSAFAPYDCYSTHQRLATAIALVFALTVPNSAAAESQADGGKSIDKGEVLYSCGKTRGKVMVQFKPDVELRELVAWAMGFSCKSFVYGKAVGGRAAKANIIVPRSMNVEQAWRVFLVGLQSMGLTVVPRGKVLAIVEMDKARSGPVPLYLRSRPSRRVQIVRKLFRPQHTSAAELGRALELLKSKQGAVASLGEQGMVLVTDYADHIVRMTELVEQVDRPHESENLYALKIRRVDAVELVKTLEELLGVGRGSGGQPAPARKARRGKKKTRASASTSELARTAVPSKLIGDPRTNTLLVVGSLAAYERVRAVVNRIDIAVDGEATGSIHLYALTNADAEELATTLQGLLSGRSVASKGASKRSKTAAGRPSIEGTVQVSFDKPTNSLLFVASTRDYLALSQIVRRLDAPRRQVYIEATVFEVSSSMEREFGLSAHGGKNTKSGGLMIGGFQSGSVSSLSPKGLAGLTGLLGGLFGKPFDLSGTSVPSFGVAVHALASNGYVDILSEPHILTADNKEAVVVGGQNVPYQSRLSALPAATGEGDSPFATGQSIARKDLALTLKITPHISSEDLLRIDFELSKEDLLAEDNPTLGPAWSTNQLKSSVVVHDQQTIVIGGIMSDRIGHEVTKVPFLGDLPILGHFFRSTRKKKRKTNLLVLLTPHIIRDQHDARRILDRRMRERAEFMSSLATLKRAPYQSHVDYGRKRGLVEEINRAVRRVDREKVLRRQLDEQIAPPADGPIVVSKRPGAAGNAR